MSNLCFANEKIAYAIFSCNFAVVAGGYFFLLKIPAMQRINAITEITMPTKVRSVLPVLLPTEENIIAMHMSIIATVVIFVTSLNKLDTLIVANFY